MPTTVNTLAIDITGNAGGIEKAAKKAENAVTGIHDGEISLSADTEEAQRKLKDAQAQAEALAGGEIPIDADTQEAAEKLKDAQEQAEALADGKYTIRPDVDTTEAESAINGLTGKIKGALAAIGGAAAAKQIFSFGVEAVGLASDYEQTLGKARQLLDDTAFQRVQAYTQGKYDKYGLNKTGILDMTTNFAGAYKSMGVDTRLAAEYAERMADAAIDYASVLNKTPQEVGEIMMSLMRGNTAVADNISLYGLTADKMMKEAKELREKGLIPEGMDEASAKYVALLNIIEKNSDTLGFTGDWDRTYEQYANQTTVLAEQWETLKTNIGTLLQPAAESIVGFTNDILKAVIGFTEGMKGHSFTEDVNGYFGTMEITEADLQPIIEKITKPMDNATAAVGTAEEKLAAANAAYQSAYGELMKTIRLIASGGELDEDTVGEAVNKVRDAAGEQINAERTNILTNFTAFMGTEKEWSEAEEAAVAQINAFFDAQIKAAEEKANALARVIHGSIHNDGTISQEEYEQIQAAAEELNQTTLDTALGRSRAALEEANVQRGGDLSAQSIMTVYNTGMEALNEAFGAYDTAFMDYKANLYAFESQQQRDRENLTEDAYFAKYGSNNVIDAEELIVKGREDYEGTKNQAAAEMIEFMSNLIVPSLLQGFEGLGSEELSAQQVREKYGTTIDAVLGMGEFAGILNDIQGKGMKIGENGEEFLQLYNGLSEVYPYGNTGTVLDDSEFYSPIPYQMLKEFMPNLLGVSFTQESLEPYDIPTVTDRDGFSVPVGVMPIGAEKYEEWGSGFSIGNLMEGLKNQTEWNEEEGGSADVAAAVEKSGDSTVEAIRGIKGTVEAVANRPIQASFRVGGIGGTWMKKIFDSDSKIKGVATWP